MNSTKILVIDDEPHISRVIAHKLQNAGYEVNIASNADVGIEKAKTTSPDLIITDYRFPGPLTGLDLVREIRAFNNARRVPIGKCTPIILLTGSIAITLQLETISQDIKNFRLLSKPFSPSKLLEEVQRMLDPSETGGKKSDA